MKIKVTRKEVIREKDYKIISITSPIDVTEEHLFTFSALQEMYDTFGSDAVFEVPKYITKEDVYDALNSPNGKAKTFGGLYVQDFLGGNRFQIRTRNSSNKGDLNYNKFTSHSENILLSDLFEDENIFVDVDNSCVHFEIYDNLRYLHPLIQTNFNDYQVRDFKITYQNKFSYLELQTEKEGNPEGYRVNERTFELIQKCGKQHCLFHVIIKMIVNYYMEFVPYSYPDQLFYDILDYLKEVGFTELKSVLDTLSRQRKYKFNFFNDNSSKFNILDEDGDNYELPKSIGSTLNRDFFSDPSNSNHNIFIHLFNNQRFWHTSYRNITFQNFYVAPQIQIHKNIKLVSRRGIGSEEVDNYDVIIEMIGNVLEITIKNYYNPISKQFRYEYENANIEITGHCRLNKVELIKTFHSKKNSTEKDSSGNNQFQGDDMKLTYVLFPFYPDDFIYGIGDSYGNGPNKMQRVDYLQTKCKDKESSFSISNDILSTIEDREFRPEYRKENFSVDFLPEKILKKLIECRLVHFRNYVGKVLIERLTRFMFITQLNGEKEKIEQYCDLLKELAEKMKEISPLFSNEIDKEQNFTEKEYIPLILEYDRS